MNETTTQAPIATGQHAYELRGVSKTYDTKGVAVRALDNVDLKVESGEFVVIVGPSGSGKSTLLQMLGALDRTTSGQVEFDGRDLATLGDKDLADIRLRTIGFIFQQFNLVPTLSAAENVELAMVPTKLPADQRAARVAELLDRVGLAARASHLPSQLSGGEQQRVAIARALANKPDVLLADEPTGNLDSQTGETILQMLYDLWQETGITVVLITHDLSIAERAPRVVRMADGRITQPATTGPESIGSEAAG